MKGNKHTQTHTHTHTHNISKGILKVFGVTICKPLELIFKQGLTTGAFPFKWKKTVSLVTKNVRN